MDRTIDRDRWRRISEILDASAATTLVLWCSAAQAQSPYGLGARQTIPFVIDMHRGLFFDRLTKRYVRIRVLGSAVGGRFGSSVHLSVFHL